MAKPELGNKHQCQHCGARFFDLNRSPITCPKCGAIFHAAPFSRGAQRAAAADDEDVEVAPGAELVSLEEADVGEDKIAVADDDVEIEVADDTFLEEEEEDSDDVVDLIDGEIEDDEER